MKSVKSPSVVVAYYEPKNESPKRRATRCTGEVIVICEQLNIISDQLLLAVQAQDVEDALRLCQLYHEDFIFRVYALFERGWDCLEILLDKPLREDKKTGLQLVKNVYPELYDAATKLHDKVDLDVRMRNVATHETFLFLGFAFGSDFKDIYEIDSVLTWEDPSSKEGERIKKMIRDGLRRFVDREREKIGQFISAAFSFASLCSDVVNSKQWENRAIAQIM